jgi:hypothetical protein
VVERARIIDLYDGRLRGYFRDPGTASGQPMTFARGPVLVVLAAAP